MKKNFVYISWDTPYQKRKEIETLQHLSLSLKFKDYDFLAERIGLHPKYIHLIFKECDIKDSKYLPLFKKAVREQLLRDVCIL